MRAGAPGYVLPVAYPLPLELTPRSFETLLARLPARARAELEWFPVERARASIGTLAHIATTQGFPIYER